MYVNDIDDVSQLSHFYVLLRACYTILSKCCSYKNYVKPFLFLVPHLLVEPNLVTSNSPDIYFSPCNCSDKMFVVLYLWSYSKWRCHPVTHCLCIFVIERHVIMLSLSKCIALMTIDIWSHIIWPRNIQYQWQESILIEITSYVISMYFECAVIHETLTYKSNHFYS